MLNASTMPPPVEIHVETAEPYEYKPKKIDDAGFMRDVGIGVAIAIGAIAILAFVIRKLHDSRLSAAAKLVDHEAVTLVGIARVTDKTYVAPLSGRTCVAATTSVRIMGEPGSNKVDYSKGAGGVPFELELRDGKRVQVPPMVMISVTPFTLPPNRERERAILEKYGNTDKHDRASFAEVVVEPGTKIAIRGMLRIEQDPETTAERGYRDDAPTRMRLDRNGDKPVTIVRIWDAPR